MTNQAAQTAAEQQWVMYVMHCCDALLLKVRWASQWIYPDLALGGVKLHVILHWPNQSSDQLLQGKKCEQQHHLCCTAHCYMSTV
jgi:hypothetical protein